MPGTLYIVATPIGNLEDITHRAVRVLREVDLIACEDTRRTRILLGHYGINTKTVSYHEHNERRRAEELCRLLAVGKSVAIVSDAGTPLISDPGFRVVRAAIDRSIPVVPVPGPVALVEALVASGLAVADFFFAGFLPVRAPARRARLRELRTIPATLICYEAPHRIAATLKDARRILGDRDAAIARELTKIHEEIARGTLNELAERFDNKTTRGELVLVISGSEPKIASAAAEESADAREITSNSLLERVRALEREGLHSRAALKQTAREFGLSRREAYRLLLAQKNRRTR